MTNYDKENFDDNPALVAKLAREAFGKAAEEAVRCGYKSHVDKNNVLHVQFRNRPARSIPLNWTKIDPANPPKLTGKLKR